MSSDDFPSRVTSIALLADPVRRALYLYVVAQAEPVSREQAAEALGVAHHVAKFHLDKMEQEGLLDAEYTRPPGRSGPGAGRPAKRYARPEHDIEVTLPERHYDLAGQVMARAITMAQTDAVPIGRALSAAAREAGQEIGRARNPMGAGHGMASAVTVISEALTDRGYAPRADGTTITLTNCPFHTLAQEHTDLVCGMNLDLVHGLLEGVGPVRLQAGLTPTPGMCCVTISEA